MYGLVSKADELLICTSRNTKTLQRYLYTDVLIFLTIAKNRSIPGAIGMQIGEGNTESTCKGLSSSLKKESHWYKLQCRKKEKREEGRKKEDTKGQIYNFTNRMYPPGSDS